MPRFSLLSIRRGLSVAAAVAIGAGALTFAAAPAMATASPSCTISFVPATIGPGEVTQASIDVEWGLENYYGIVSVNGVDTAPQPIGNTSSGPIPYEILAAMATGGSPAVLEKTVLDYRIYWDAPSRRRGEPAPECHAELTLLPPVSKPVTPEGPTSTAIAAKLTLKVPVGAPLSAGSAKVMATSTGKAAIALQSLSTNVCRVADTGSVKLVKAGECRLQATQAGADAATASFPVWGFPSLPAKARSTQVLPVLGKGEASYKVVATPAGVCRATDGDVALIDGGVCHVQVRSGDDVVRTDKVKVSVPAKPASPKHSMDIGATVYFGFDSARLTAEGKATLRKVAPLLRKADLVVVYGHTYGPGKNSPASRALAAKRARVSVEFLDGLGVKAKAVSQVAMAMQQPVSNTAWKNRRAEVYYR
jgi:outer membrane protein OmpA-like peptidoglycan-associated protein